MLHECLLDRNNSPVNVEFMYARTVCAGPSVAGHVCTCVAFFLLLSSVFSFQKQAELINGPLQGIRLCSDQNTPDETFGSRQSLYYTAKGPLVPGCSIIYDDHHIVDVKVSPGVSPLLALLHEWQVFFYPPLPEQIRNILDLFPSLPAVDVIFAEEPRWHEGFSFQLQ